MAEQRIRGEQVQFRISRAGTLVRTLTAVKSMTFTALVEMVSRGYLGETTERKDEIYKGVSIEATFDVESPDAWDLIAAVRNRAVARRYDNTTIITCSFTGLFAGANGVPIKRRMTVPDVKSGAMPIAIGSREEYVGQTLTFGASDFKGPSQ
jgi:hypothetical protein